MKDSRFSTAAVLLLLGTAALSFNGCTRQEHPQQKEATASGASPLVAKGKSVYLSTCIACHHSNPQKPGALGPEVWGSSRELLEARILTGTYPPGYKPKRPTHAMQPLPHLKSEIDSLHAYLNSTQP